MRLIYKHMFFISSNRHSGEHLCSRHCFSKSYGSVEERRIDNALLQERESIGKEREEISMRKKELKTLEEGVDKKLTEIDRKLEELRKLQIKSRLFWQASPRQRKNGPRNWPASTKKCHLSKQLRR